MKHVSNSSMCGFMSNQFSDFWLSCIINGTFIQNVDTRFSVLLNVDGFLLRIGKLVSYLGRKIILGSSKEHTSILRKNGFLTRTADEECRRSNRLELTDKGRKAVEIWESEIMIVEKRLLSGFSDDEARLLKEYLVRLIENMQGARHE